MRRERRNVLHFSALRLDMASGYLAQAECYGVQPKCGYIQPNLPRIIAFISGVNVECQSPTTPLRKNEPLCTSPGERPPVSVANEVRATQPATRSSPAATPRKRNSAAATGDVAARM